MSEQLERLKQWAAELEQRQLAGRLKRRSEQGLWKPSATSATELGYECLRRIAYRRVIPWAAEPISAELASIFEEGEHHERLVLRELEDELGVKLRERNSAFRDPDLDIVGRIDAEAYVEGVGWVPTEVKGLAFIPGDDVEGADLAEDEKPLHRRYFAQLQTYLLLRGKEQGLFIFKSKVTGRWRCIAVGLDYDAGEVLFRRAERVRDAVKAYVAAFATVRPFTQDGPGPEPTLKENDDWWQALDAAEPHLPQRIPDRSECGQCPFRRTCNPSEAPIDPALLVEDRTLIAQLEVLEQMRPHRRSYENIHRKVRERFALTAGETFFAGPFKVEKAPHGKTWKLVITNQQEENRGPDPE